MKVVIVGGVAAGMSAAARLRRLDEDAKIIVFERDEYVSFANCGLPYHIGGDIPERESLLVVTPERLERQLNIEVHTCHEVTKIERGRRVVHVFDRQQNRHFEETYDKLVLAQGAAPLQPPLPGIDHPKIFTLRNIPDMDLIKLNVDDGAESALVIGGGYIGVEVAEAFRNRGVNTYLVEMLDEILPPLDHEMDRALVHHIQSMGVGLLLGRRVESFRDVEGQVEVRLDREEAVRVDMVVLAVGVRPESSLAQEAELEVGSRGGLKTDQHMRTSDPDIYAVGDMVEVSDTVTGEQTMVALAGPANRQGRVAADHICGRDSAYTSTQGTSIIKVFEMTAGGTGATEQTLRRTKTPYKKIYLHLNGHASYYPGTHPMHLKLLFAPGDGRILGAQAVGVDGVDKRIDVFATALRAGMTVFDLEHLELAYAPPYGSAKDPVNMAGFVASNVLRGDIEHWYAEDYPDDTKDGRLIDVRTRGEFAEWHIEGAVNLPITELRERLDELDSQTPMYVYCKSGFRGYLAARVLQQRGFSKVQNLSGGVDTFRLYHRLLEGFSEVDIPFVTYAEERFASNQ
ncbi:MAG: FAD-dependent oxidoreductase [Arenicellales bacterium]|nr:FAD-dependent oxidoreductase [Arenicellales bacterium]